MNNHSWLAVGKYTQAGQAQILSYLSRAIDRSEYYVN
jgi:hypothetical protein